MYKMTKEKGGKHSQIVMWYILPSLGAIFAKKNTFC